MTNHPTPRPAQAVIAALELLDKHRLVLAIHDPSFPSLPDEDLGRGSPYGGGGRDFLHFARSLGFDGIQFGPQGQVSRSNPSPYDSTLFSRNLLNIDLQALAEDPEWAGILTPDWLDRAVAGKPEGDGRLVPHGYVFDTYRAALKALHRRFLAVRDDPRGAALARELAEFQARQQRWLAGDALYFAIANQYGERHYRHWPSGGEARYDASLLRPPPGAEADCARRRAELEQTWAGHLERYVLGQFIVHRQHQALRSLANGWGLRLYADLQVGLSPCDEWQRAGLYLQSYRLGAPPSRTNPEGQPWGYGVLDPDQYRGPEGEPGPALGFLHSRVEKLFEEFDGLRIDHPHGLICPWVYRTDDPDPLHAVQTGARLFDSPDLPDHPQLARYCIPRRDQLSPDPATPRYADDWVRELEPDQVARYSALLDALVESVRAHGGGLDDLVCEVLSTCPYPLMRVMERHGLGRFRVTQKANLDDPADVYRSENAEPADWIMVGNHDTPPVWALARQWQGTPALERQARYLAERLRPDGDAGALAQELAGDRHKLVHAKVADIFASPARHVSVFFSDLLGMEDSYNRPGIVHEENWLLRVPSSFRERYAEGCRSGAALNLPRVLALALRARGQSFAREQAAVLAELDRLAGWWAERPD